MEENEIGLLPAVEVVTAEPVTASVIWLHGLGADGHDFEPLVPCLGLEPRGVRFVFPHAPSIPVSINAGSVMPAWYDIHDGDLSRRHDEAGIRQSHLRIEALLAREVARGIPAHRIVLAGFSQGGAMALFTGLRHAERLAGILALSCYLVLEETLAEECSPANQDVPIFQAHGLADPMVAIARGLAARADLTARGYSVEWHEYPMQHEVCPEQIAQVSVWLRRVLDVD